MEMTKKNIHISQLLLDSENPRHEVLSNQPEIIKQLIDKEQIISLAKDIAEQGSLSPLEIVGVLPMGKDEFVVIEGNRRVCACLLLNNPSLCPTKDLAKKIRQIKTNGSIPSEIECVIFDDRESADHWMQLRHEGQQEGVGTKKWDADQKARHAEKHGRKNPNIQATKLLDYALNQGIISYDEKSDYSITTLQRYLNNPVVRNVFGLEDRDNLTSRHEKNDFKRLIIRFLDDAKDDSIISSRSKQKDWVDYANVLSKQVVDPPSKSNPLTNYSVEPENKVKETPAKKRSKKDPSKRKFLIPQEISFPIGDKTVRRVYQEIRNLEIDGHEFAVAYLFRAFLEGLAVCYFKKNLPNELQKDTMLHNKLQVISSHLLSNGIKKKDLRSLNIAASSENSLLSPLIIGSMVHLSIIPTKRELIAIWDRMENIMQTICGRS